MRRFFGKLYVQVLIGVFAGIAFSLQKLWKFRLGKGRSICNYLEVREIYCNH